MELSNILGINDFPDMDWVAAPHTFRGEQIVEVGLAVRLRVFIEIATVWKRGTAFATVETFNMVGSGTSRYKLPGDDLFTTVARGGLGR